MSAGTHADPASRSHLGRGAHPERRTLARRAISAAIVIPLLLVATASPARAALEPRLWTRLYGPYRGISDNAGLAVTADSSVVVTTGEIFVGAGSAIATVAYASDGARLWTDRFDGPTPETDAPNAIEASPTADAVFVAGSSRGASGFDDIVAIAHRATTGERLWVTRVGKSAEPDQGIDLVVAPDGSAVFVTGVTYDRETFTPMMRTVAIDASTGERLWSRRAGSTAGAAGRAIAVSSDGGTVFAIADSSLNGGDTLIIAYDAATGDRRWRARYTGPAGGEDRATDVVTSPTGSEVFVAIASMSATDHFDYVVAAYDAATGDPTWADRYDGPGHSVDQPSALTVAPDGSSVFVSGRSVDGVHGYTYGTLGYDAVTGDRVWTKHYAGNAGYGGEAADITIGPNGTVVYVTGTIGGRAHGIETYEDIATVAYDAASGTRLKAQIQRSACGFNEQGRAVEAGPDGTAVYVGGIRVCHEGKPGTALFTIGYGA